MIVRERRVATIIPLNAARRAVRSHVLGELTCGFAGGERGIATGANGIAHRMESIVHLPDAVAVTVRPDVRRSIVSRAATHVALLFADGCQQLRIDPMCRRGTLDDSRKREAVRQVPIGGTGTGDRVARWYRL